MFSQAATMTSILDAVETASSSQRTAQKQPAVRDMAVAAVAAASSSSSTTAASGSKHPAVGAASASASTASVASSTAASLGHTPLLPPPSCTISPASSHKYEGGVYTGSWRDNKPDGGWGEHISSLGAAFRGAFHDGWAKGAGTYFWLDGRAEVGRFRGPLERLPTLAAYGEGARWSKDRTHAWRLKDGVELEKIELPIAEQIARSLGLEPPGPSETRDHGAARVSKRELDDLILPLLSKRQTTELDARRSGGTSTSGETEELSFEDLWRVLTS